MIFNYLLVLITVVSLSNRASMGFFLESGLHLEREKKSQSLGFSLFGIGRMQGI